MSSQILIKSADFEQFPFELRALTDAKNYQAWIYRSIESFLGSRILEIGAGIGNMSKWLPVREKLILTELDPVLSQVLERSFLEANAPNSRILVQRLDVLSDSLEAIQNENIDTIVSFNVLEHVEDDRLVFQKLCEILRSSSAPGPRRLVTLVPAHSWAFGSMDKEFGHYRRYSARPLSKMLKEIAPDTKQTLRYFNAFGLVGWVINGRIMKKKKIGLGSIRAFEKICPFLAPLDDFAHSYLRLPLGQSLLSVVEWN